MDRSGVAPRGGRTRSACDLCRHKKIRCDGVKPACETCRLAGIHCTFTPPSPQPYKTMREQLSDTKAQVKALEALLAKKNDRQLQASASPAPTNSSPTYLRHSRDFAVALEAFQWHLSFSQLGPANSAKRASFESTVFQHTGYMFNLDEFSKQVTQSFKLDFPGEHMERTIQPIWPTTYLVQQCIDYFDRSQLYSIFPVVETSALQSLLHDNILSYQGYPPRAADQACLAGFTALVTRIHRHSPVFAHCDSDAYVQAALTLLPDLLMGEQDIRTLEALLLLALHIAPLGQPESAQLLLAAAIRIVISMGANKIDHSRIHDKHYQHIRCLFWHCYAVDKEMSLRKGQPPVFNDIDCDLDLPTNYVSQSSDHQFLSKPLTPDVILFPSDLRMVRIKSKVYILLYSNHALNQPEARRIQHLRELDQELSDLKASFPAGFQPDAFATEDAPDYLLHDLSIRGVCIHLEYYHCMGKIHEASTLCKVPETDWSPLSSSIELYHQSARSTLLFISRIPGFVNPEMFWIHAQFMLTAVVSIFLHLIKVPTAPSFASDLQLLKKTGEIFSSLKQITSEREIFPPFYIADALTKQLIILVEQSLVVSR